ncbi:hypothetical protein BDC45DRAFT_601663 [Circinella umbellata]|nr:hypothetical protein BDC45DRAFT_601663 [Circinella umbellata]
MSFNTEPVLLIGSWWCMNYFNGAYISNFNWNQTVARGTKNVILFFKTKIL